MSAPRSIIVGSGCYIPGRRVPNAYFLEHDFRDMSGNRIAKSNDQIVEQFEAITGIKERRYVEDDQTASDIAAAAAENALDSSGVDREQLDYLIVAHNFGDVRAGSRRSDMVPALAARVKYMLGIHNPNTVAFDLIFGCPGWLQGMIQADCMIRSGDIRRAMVIGSETLSRVIDPYDRDSMIYADGAGATILQAADKDAGAGILSYAVRSDTIEHSQMLLMAPSFSSEEANGDIFLKMEGRKLYRYALQTVPGAIRECLDRAGVALEDVRKILIHQANEKMDEAIVAALYSSYGQQMPSGVMPMIIGWLGNSSVATLPTLYDLMVRGEIEDQRLDSGDLVVFASVGAGMHINAFAYRMP